MFYWFTVTPLKRSPMNGGWKHRASPPGKAARCKHASSVWITPQESGLCVDNDPTHLSQKSQHGVYSQWRHSSPQRDFNSERMCRNRLESHCETACVYTCPFILSHLVLYKGRLQAFQILKQMAKQEGRR